ncbi:MAG TPA: hypothetical protein PKK01_05395 [Mycobacterium sp.]|nr:hypothetical protein [Mycobacterium sp.]HQE15056.1 hypothetical protein [Mycobacterium sp.]
MTVLPRGAKNRRGGRRPGWLLLTALLVLAILASTTLVFTNRVELLRLAVILSLWAAVLAAFASVIYRRQSQLDAAKARDMKFVYDLQLDREISARREYELAVEAHLRRQLAVEVRAQAADEMGALRAELATLRANLQALLGADLGERPALESERVADAALSEPLAMPPAPGRVHSSRVTADTEEFAAHVGTTQVEVTRVEVVAEVDLGGESPIIDVPEEPLVTAAPLPPASEPPVSQPPVSQPPVSQPPVSPPPVPPRTRRRQQTPPVDQQPPSIENGSHRRQETDGAWQRPAPAPRTAPTPRPALAPRSAPPPRRTAPQQPPAASPSGPGWAPQPPRPPIPPPGPTTPWRPPETRTRPGRHRGFEEQAADTGSGPAPQHRAPGGRHANEAPDDHAADVAGRHRNAAQNGPVEQAVAEAPHGQHAGGAPVADLVARLRGGNPSSDRSGGGGRRRRED